MIKKILVPIDGSEHAEQAVEFAANVAMQNDATIHLLHVISSTKIPQDVVDFVKSERIEDSGGFADDQAKTILLRL